MDFSKIAEQKIAEAIEEGLFDDLPGKGKPLNLDEDAAVPAHLRLVNGILKNAGVAPEWVVMQKELALEREETGKLRARLLREHKARVAKVAALPDYHVEKSAFAVWHAKSRDAYLRRLKNVNTSILKFNIATPTSAIVFIPYKIDEEMERFDAEFAPLTADVPAAKIEPEREESLLRQAARLRAQNRGAMAGSEKSNSSDSADTQSQPENRI